MLFQKQHCRLTDLIKTFVTVTMPCFFAVHVYLSVTALISQGDNGPNCAAFHETRTHAIHICKYSYTLCPNIMIILENADILFTSLN
jgi:hypothetical protein